MGEKRLKIAGIAGRFWSFLAHFLNNFENRPNPKNSNGDQ
jgi:hypothetical protein